MAGTLYVVATPIGHLDDITIRALRVLREVSVVAAEDTRRTGNLLRHFNIPTPLVSVHEHNERLRAPQLVERMLTGDSVALVTDAGTPGISDPGSILVGEARARGLKVVPVPGPSAVMAALSVAGLPMSSFTFAGFPPNRGKPRKQWFRELETMNDRAVVFFEAPHRIVSTLSELAIYVNRPIIVARELTKVHEEILTGAPESISAHLTEPKGEFTIVIPAAPVNAREPVSVDIAQVNAEIGQITDKQLAKSRRQAARLVAERLGLSTRQVYEVMPRLPDEPAKP